MTGIRFLVCDCRRCGPHGAPAADFARGLRELRQKSVTYGRRCEPCTAGRHVEIIDRLALDS